MVLRLRMEWPMALQLQQRTAVDVPKCFQTTRSRSISVLSNRPSPQQKIPHLILPITLSVLNASLSKTHILNNSFPYSRLVKTGQLTDNNRLMLQRVQYLTSLAPDRQQGVPDAFLNDKAGKKMFFPNIFMNSEEFKDLGNLH